MSKIAIVTDSTAYLTKEETERHNITVLPLTVNFSDGFIYDGLVDTKEFFARVDKEDKLPFTSQPSTGLFTETFEKLVAEDKEVVCVHVSAEISGTCDSARQAAQMVNPEKITVIDSKTTSASLAFMVLAAAQWAEKGISREEISARLTQAAEEIRTFFIVDTLEYLSKGGRIGGAQALLGSVLQIKPILYFLDGKAEVFDKVRTRKKAILKMLEQLPREEKPLQAAVLHCEVAGEAEEVKEKILEMAPQAQVTIRELGPVLSTHSGPRALGLCYWVNKWADH